MLLNWLFSKTNKAQKKIIYFWALLNSSLTKQQIELAQIKTLSQNSGEINVKNTLNVEKNPFPCGTAVLLLLFLLAPFGILSLSTK